ncbi:unnamed protein product [Amoebophrya sp. A25]|nr:unnamed protein product [Amoebophrya sp. A25]|eukprot:GSA25T00020085001.1
MKMMIFRRSSWLLSGAALPLFSVFWTAAAMQSDEDSDESYASSGSEPIDDTKVAKKYESVLTKLRCELTEAETFIGLYDNKDEQTKIQREEAEGTRNWIRSLSREQREGYARKYGDDYLSNLKFECQATLRDLDDKFLTYIRMKERVDCLQVQINSTKDEARKAQTNRGRAGASGRTKGLRCDEQECREHELKRRCQDAENTCEYLEETQELQHKKRLLFEDQKLLSGQLKDARNTINNRSSTATDRQRVVQDFPKLQQKANFLKGEIDKIDQRLAYLENRQKKIYARMKRDARRAKKQQRRPPQQREAGASSSSAGREAVSETKITQLEQSQAASPKLALENPETRPVSVSAAPSTACFSPETSEAPNRPSSSSVRSALDAACRRGDSPRAVLDPLSGEGGSHADSSSPAVVPSSGGRQSRPGVAQVVTPSRENETDAATITGTCAPLNTVADTSTPAVDNCFSLIPRTTTGNSAMIAEVAEAKAVVKAEWSRIPAWEKRLASYTDLWKILVKDAEDTQEKWEKPLPQDYEQQLKSGELQLSATYVAPLARAAARRFIAFVGDAEPWKSIAEPLLDDLAYNFQYDKVPSEKHWNLLEQALWDDVREMNFPGWEPLRAQFFSGSQANFIVDPLQDSFGQTAVKILYELGLDKIYFYHVLKHKFCTKESQRTKLNEALRRLARRNLIAGSESRELRPGEIEMHKRLVSVVERLSLLKEHCNANIATASEDGTAVKSDRSQKENFGINPDVNEQQKGQWESLQHYLRCKHANDLAAKASAEAAAAGSGVRNAPPAASQRLLRVIIPRVPAAPAPGGSSAAPGNPAVRQRNAAVQAQGNAIGQSNPAGPGNPVGPGDPARRQRNAGGQGNAIGESNLAGSGNPAGPGDPAGRQRNAAGQSNPAGQGNPAVPQPARRGLGAGAITGIALGSVAGVGIIGGLAFFFLL